MKKIFFLFTIIIGLSLLINVVYADNPENDEKGLFYRPKLKFPKTIVQNYRMDEQTRIIRTYEDGTSATFNREYTYFFHLKAPGGPKDGIQKINVTIDSMNYKYTDGKKEIEFYNYQDLPAPTNRMDFLNTYIPSGKFFDIYYSDYGEVAKVEGEELQRDRDFLVDPKYGIKNNDYKLKMFQNRLSDNQLLHIVDVAKGLLPYEEVELDSSWTCEVNFNINNIPFGQVTTGVVDKLINTYFYINIKSDSMDVKNKEYILTDTKQIAEIEEAIADTEFELKISSRGVVEYLSAKANAEVYGTIGNMKFKEEIYSLTNWNLVGLYKY